MKHTLQSWLVAVALLLTSTLAQAAINCTISSPGFFSVYDALAPSDNRTVGTYTLNCTRLGSDPTTLNYIAFTNEGLYNLGQNTRAKLSTGNSYIQYDLFIDANYGANWAKSNRCIIGTVNFGTALNGSQGKAYYAAIPAGQTGAPQGLYNDTVTVLVAYNRTSCAPNVTGDIFSTFPVQIANRSACQIAIPPGTVAFSYTAFSSTPAIASTTFSTRCSTNLPYTMSLDANFGVVSGLNYGLTLSATNATGNGALQSFTINGTMAAGQAGSCTTGSCTATETRRLIVTY